MTSGYARGNDDFDDIFEPEKDGNGVDAPADYERSNGALLRYAAIAHGSKAPDVGYADASNIDLSNRWAAKGSVVYTDVITPGFASGSYDVDTAFSHNSGFSFDLTLFSDGTWTTTVTKIKPGSSNNSPPSGNWLGHPGAGAGAAYEVAIDASHIFASAGEADNASYTPTTGYQSLGSNVSITAGGHCLGGGAPDSEGASVGGYWTLTFRKKGTTETVVAKLYFNGSAS